MLPDLKHLTGADWRNAKKAAGVKGAGFFDGASSKAVADKIDRYQQKKATFEKGATSKNFQELVSTLLALETALSKAETDRSFKSDLAKELQADIGKLLKEVTAAQVDCAKIVNDKKVMEALDQGNKDQLKGIVGELGFKL